MLIPFGFHPLSLDRPFFRRQRPIFLEIRPPFSENAALSHSFSGTPLPKFPPPFLTTFSLVTVLSIRAETYSTGGRPSNSPSHGLFLPILHLSRFLTDLSMNLYRSFANVVRGVRPPVHTCLPGYVGTCDGHVAGLRMT